MREREKSLLTNKDLIRIVVCILFYLFCSNLFSDCGLRFAILNLVIIAFVFGFFAYKKGLYKICIGLAQEPKNKAVRNALLVAMVLINSVIVLVLFYISSSLDVQTHTETNALDLSLISERFGLDFEYIVFYALTGLTEELLLCAILFNSFINIFELSAKNSSNILLRSAFVASLIFSLMHFEASMNLAILLVRFIQVYFFSFSMCALFVTSRTVIAPAIAHGIYDCIYFWVPFMLTNSIIQPYALLSENFSMLPIYALSATCFVPSFIFSINALRKTDLSLGHLSQG